MSGALAPIAAGFGLGIALAGAPGPVQAIILTETMRGGMSRGMRVQAGANLTFAALLVALALGLSVVVPSGAVLRALEIVGGFFLIVVAADGIRASGASDDAAGRRVVLVPEARGILAVVLNPGAWLFLATAASSLFASAVHTGGTPDAVMAALALAIGLALGDGAVVLLGGVGMRKMRAGGVLWIRRGLAAIVGALGIWLVVTGVVS